MTRTQVASMREGREVERRVCGEDRELERRACARVEGRELEVHGMYEMEEWRKVYLEQLGKSIEHT